jgi:hypothetical protein
VAKKDPRPTGSLTQHFVETSSLYLMRGRIEGSFRFAEIVADALSASREHGARLFYKAVHHNAQLLQDPIPKGKK